MWIAIVIGEDTVTVTSFWWSRFELGILLEPFYFRCLQKPIRSSQESKVWQHVNCGPKKAWSNGIERRIGMPWTWTLGVNKNYFFCLVWCILLNLFILVVKQNNHQSKTTNLNALVQFHRSPSHHFNRFNLKRSSFTGLEVPILTMKLFKVIKSYQNDID